MKWLSFRSQRSAYRFVLNDVVLALLSIPLLSHEIAIASLSTKLLEQSCLWVALVSLCSKLISFRCQRYCIYYIYRLAIPSVHIASLFITNRSQRSGSRFVLNDVALVSFSTTLLEQSCLWVTLASLSTKWLSFRSQRNCSRFALSWARFAVNDVYIISIISLRYSVSSYRFAFHNDSFSRKLLSFRCLWVALVSPSMKWLLSLSCSRFLATYPFFITHWI